MDTSAHPNDRELPLTLRAYRSAVRRLPMRSGTRWLTHSKLARRMLDDAPRHSIAYIDGSVPIAVDLHDWDGRALFYLGTADPKIRDVVRALARPGEVFFDIGANHGSIGVTALPVVGEAGAVHLVEPQPCLTTRLRDMRQAVGASNLSVHAIGLGNRNRTAKMKVPRFHSGAASVVQNEEASDLDLADVPIRNTSEFVSEHTDSRPFGAKVDVEGAELRVVPHLLANPNCRFVVFEANRDREQLFAAAQNAGMAVYGIAKGVLRSKLRRVRTAEAMERYWDFVAVRGSGNHKDVADGTEAIARLRD